MLLETKEGIERKLLETKTGDADKQFDWNRVVFEETIR